jgi:hypothetical protein
VADRVLWLEDGRLSHVQAAARGPASA